MEIRAANTEDFLAIASLDRVAWRDSVHGEFIPDGEHVWRIWCEHAFTYVAVDESGGVRGAAVAFPCRGTAHCLHKVIVDASSRGRGIGSGLFRAMLTELDRAQRSCFLTVDPANAAAIALYRKYGFGADKRVDGFYRPEENRLVLIREPVL